MTQRETVLAMLQAGPVCGTSFLKARIPRYAARVLELRAEGYTIDTEKCADWRHEHRTHQIRYVLLGAKQGELF